MIHRQARLEVDPALGEAGAEPVFGVIYPPQVALVGFGTVTERAWVGEGGLGVMPCVTLNPAADQQVSTGHQAGRRAGLEAGADALSSRR